MTTGDTARRPGSLSSASAGGPLSSSSSGTAFARRCFSDAFSAACQRASNDPRGNHGGGLATFDRFAVKVPHTRVAETVGVGIAGEHVLPTRRGRGSTPANVGPVVLR